MSDRMPWDACSIPLIYGIDFSSAPSSSKPVMLAAARVVRRGPEVTCEVLSLFAFRTLDALEQFLTESPPWVAAIDMPFGLSRLITDVLQWPGYRAAPDTAWDTWADFYTSLTRPEIREVFKAWCDAHPPGQKFAHRACDRPAKSSPSMKWVNPPVAYMLHAGAALLQRLDVRLPGMRPNGRADRVALEAYPGFMARQWLQAKSYKHDDARMQSAARDEQRRHLIDRLSQLANGLTVHVHPDIAQAMQADGKGDALDAVLCIMQAVLGWMRDPVTFDQPAGADPLEGWIVNVPWRDSGCSADTMESVAAAALRKRIYAAVSEPTRQRLSLLGAGVTGPAETQGADSIQDPLKGSACQPSD